MADFDAIDTILIGRLHRELKYKSDQERVKIYQTITEVASWYRIPVIQFPIYHEHIIESPKSIMERIKSYFISTPNHETLDGELIAPSQWIQDFGPFFTRNLVTGEISIVDVARNVRSIEVHQDELDDAYLQKDDAAIKNARFHLAADELYEKFTQRFAQRHVQYQYSFKHFPFDIQGGRIVSNGRGTCLVSEGIFFENSWPAEMVAELGDQFTQEFAKEFFMRKSKDHLACINVVFLNPLLLEQTEHLDMTFAFVKPYVLVVGVYKEEDDPGNYMVQEENIKILKKELPEVKIVRMPMPTNCPAEPPHYEKRCDRTAEEELYFRTYVNAVIIKKHIIMPVYELDRRYETEAKRIWNDLGYEVVTVESEQIIREHGSVHCMTRFVPKPGRLRYKLKQ